MSNHKKDIEYVGDSRVPAKRTPNISPSYAEFPGKSEAFWPNFLLKEWMVAAVVLIAFLVLTVSHPAPLEAKADPNNAGYIPLPDWYFLFLYQLLKYPWASGPYVVFGSLVIPLITFGSLILAPWIDKGPERRPSKRPIATSVMLLAIVSIVYLTWAAMDEHSKLHPAAAAGASGGSAAKPPADFKPAAIWTDKTKTSCQACHGANMEGGAGPALWNVGSKLSEKQILDKIKNGGGAMPPGGMFQGTEQEKQELAHYLSTLKGGNGSSSGASSDTSSAPAAGSDNKAAAPAASSQPAANNAGAAAPAGGTAAAGGAVSVAAGQDLVNQNGCMGCHGQDLKGGAGPNLHGVVDRLKPEGVKEVLTKGRNSMPPLAASWTDQQKDSVVAYLKSLK